MTNRMTKQRHLLRESDCVFLRRGVPLLNGDLERSDAGGLRKLGVDRKEGIVGLLKAKVSHPGYVSHSETYERPYYDSVDWA